MFWTGYHFLGKLVRIIHRLQNTAALYQEHCPQWTFIVTKYVKFLITKMMFIIRDVLWKDGHITVRSSPSSPAREWKNRSSHWEHTDQDIHNLRVWLISPGSKQTSGTVNALCQHLTNLSDSFNLRRTAQYILRSVPS